ncbi:phosphopentomutase [Aliidiomarina halalkaliphila]|uniref:Phosphopentomutase n=1 Tax=Aliidiomarina halalkaliphila TaxID=2593535 RepID=A0A552X1L8_9GAMM|nr:phosphopentomutase [Aliidiomarina halalkaliphila]TRW48940.1 phosphopentomutase [Aliidiomarina halalkaliphila]
MARAIILMMDSFGVGASADAADFGDVGANTFGHIAEACAKGEADEGRSGPLSLPNLEKLGLGLLAEESGGERPPGMNFNGPADALYGYAQELSRGKDTPSGHWEIAGVPVLFDWHYFPQEIPTFPADLIDELIAEGDLPGILGNCHASGTEIIARLGSEHMATGKPIVYTSADSVLQIAAHEESFGLERLLALSELARKKLDSHGLRVGRVIARPFLGDSPDTFKRTGNRRDYSVLPPAPTVLDKLKEAGGEVISIGKIADIYAQQGITQQVKASGNDALFDATLAALDSAPDRSVIFPNFVDFDMEYGHRRNVAGYARALEAFDQRLPELLAKLKDGDRVFITADHGCDPTWPGTDHTREYVPVICFGPGIKGGNIGRRESFADIGQSIAQHLKLPPTEYGKSFL